MSPLPDGPILTLCDTTCGFSATFVYQDLRYIRYFAPLISVESQQEFRDWLSYIATDVQLVIATRASNVVG